MRFMRIRFPVLCLLMGGVQAQQIPAVYRQLARVRIGDSVGMCGASYCEIEIIIAPGVVCSLLEAFLDPKRFPPKTWIRAIT